MARIIWATDPIYAQKEAMKRRVDYVRNPLSLKRIRKEMSQRISAVWLQAAVLQLLVCPLV